jgi:hypothetical protein
MCKAFDSQMGAVRIFPKGGGQRHRGPKTTVLPAGWKPIEASKYVRKRGKRADVSDVVNSGVLGRDESALIIVHMYNGYPCTPQTAKRQASVIKAVKGRNIPIFVVQKVEPSEEKKIGAAVSNTLPGFLREAVGDYRQLFYYAEKDLGNALEGMDLKDGASLRNFLIASRVRVAIVFGQSYTQCVDSTILGMYDGRPTERDKTRPAGVPDEEWYPYHSGLLDVGISVATSRDVLDPAQGSPFPDGSDYFKFSMLSDIKLNGASPPTEESASDTRKDLFAAMDAATSFADQVH